MTTAYADFLKSKDRKWHGCGFDPGDIHASLYPFQADIVRWALRKGRAAIFADCGLGKTPMQLEWARQVSEREGKPVLIFAPLAVSQQTVREGEKFGIPVTICRTEADARPGVNITNYEKLEHFKPDRFCGVVLDESSILKGFDRHYRKALTVWASGLNYRLACTATPAPNDLLEITNHAEFLGVLSGKEAIARFFITDGNTTHAWRLRGHAVAPFYEWLASWAVALRAPSDLGYEDDGFILPALHVEDMIVEADHPLDGILFPLPASGLAERRAARSASTDERVRVIAKEVNQSTERWVLWCNLNKESEALTASIHDAREVTGSQDPDTKEELLSAFTRGEIRVLVTKPTIAGFGLNWQHCHNMAFVGLSDSYEQFYQAIRRCWRFGQGTPVNVKIVVSHLEGGVTENVRRKEAQAAEMFDQLVKSMRPYEEVNVQTSDGAPSILSREWESASGDDWKMYLGDSVQILPEIEDEIVGLSVFSPPFPGMYAYTDKPEDIGNTSSIVELLEHFAYIVPELLRVTMPGRSCAVHLTQEPIFKGKDGYVGLRDFRGEVIRLFQSHGWIFYGEVTIDKDPQIKAIRTKDHSLLFKTLASDSSHCRMALADYMLQFRKPGENLVPVPSGISSRYKNGGGWISSEEWIEWAAPVWYRATPDYPGGIKETDVLNTTAAREDKDQKHICPLQLGVIERAVKLWTAPGDLVFSPFAGIGSEGFVSLQNERRFMGIELKREYFLVACENLARAKAQLSIFDEVQG